MTDARNKDDIIKSDPSARENAAASPRPISRRSLLAAGAGVPVVAASAMAGVAAQEQGPTGAKPSHGHVIVIGGGFCGVTAARELGSHGYKVTLLEARNRLGGRTFTTEFAGELADMGGTWVHWLQPHVWAEIRRYGMELEETLGGVADDVIYLDYDGKRHETKFSEIWPKLSDYEATLQKFFPDAYEVMPRPASPLADDAWIKADRFSVQDKLNSSNLTDIERIFCDTMFTTCGAAPPDQISWVDMMRWYALTGYNGIVMNDAVIRFKIKGGTKALLDKIAADSGADIRLGTPIYRVRQMERGVEVTTDSDEKITADAVVCTVPLNVLKDVEFSPKLLSAKLTASKQTHAGQGTKLHIQVDKEYPVFGGWAPGGKAPINYLLWDSVKNGHTHLIAFGPSTDTLDMNDSDAVEAAVRQFLPDAKVLQAFGYGWNVDPYSQGVWFVSRPGQMSKIIGEMQQSQGNIHFANSDWANGWRGFIDGAIEQGLVAARNVRNQLEA